MLRRIPIGENTTKEVLSTGACCGYDQGVLYIKRIISPLKTAFSGHLFSQGAMMLVQGASNL